MHSGLIVAESKARVICSDLWDQNVRYSGKFVELLHEKFVRNGYEFSIDNFEFHAGDAMNLIYRDDLFDLVVSFNALEHIPDPEKALSEMLRVLKPGGLLYIRFDPVWTCDSGSHFYHLVSSPWQHLLSDDDSFCQAIIGAGGGVYEVEEYRSAMNRHRPDYYRKIFAQIHPISTFLFENEWSGCSHDLNRQHPNFARCLDAGFSEEELMLRGMLRLIVKGM